TRDCVCLMRTVEDKILVPEPPKTVHGDNGSFIDKIISDLNRAPDSPDQFYCFHCKDVLRAGEACKRCTCTKCGSGLSKGLCYICGHNQNSLNDSPSISEPSSQSPPNINHCCYECGDPLDGIFCKQCTCKSCGKDAHIGYNYPSKVSVISNPEPCNNQTIDELLQTLPIFHPTFHSEAESPFTLDSTPTYVDESPNVFNPPPQPLVFPYEPVLSTKEPDNSLSMGDEHLDTIPATESDEFIKSGVENLIPIPSESKGIPEHMCDVSSHDNCPPLDVSKDTIEDFSESNEEFSLTDDDSYSLDDIDYVEASPPDSELVSSEVMEIVIPEVGGIKAPNDNPIPFYDPIIPGTPPNLTPSGETFLNDDHSSNFKTKSSSTYLNSLLEETNNFDNSLPEFTTFSKVPFDAECESDSSEDQSSSDEDILEKIVSTPLSEEEIIPMESLRIDETDCDFEEDIRLIERLLYDNSSPRPPKEFVSVNYDAAIKSFSPSPIFVKDSDSLMDEIDLFCTSDYPMPPGIVDKDYESERDILIRKDLPSNNSLSFAEKESFHFDIPSFSRPSAKPPDGDTRILNIKMMGDISDQKAFMHKLVITLASHQEKSPDLLSHRCGTIKNFNTHRSHLNTCPMLINGQNNPPLDVLLFYFYPP
nr:hypothetical protein [Tanacetum cinerariifolium]